MTGLIIDNFAGGGGASVGIERALGRKIDIAINHNHSALAMHKANHPETKHLCEDIWEVDPREACAGRPVDYVWFSPDCTHFSKARGGKPVKKNIRGLAWVVLKWAALVKPKVIFVENVEEFKGWGPTKRGKPVKSKKGLTFERWVGQFRDLGYAVEWKELPAHHFGAPTSRKRLFIVARRDGLPITFPEPTHGPGLQPYRSAADIINWSILCPSIFERKKPLAEKTLDRIARGLWKFVIEHPDPFIIPISDWSGKGAGRPVSEPLTTVTASPKGGKHALVTPYTMAFYGTKDGKDLRVPDIREPLKTQTASGNRFALAMPFLRRDMGCSIGGDINHPAPTVSAGGMGKTSLVTAWLAKHFGGVTGQSIDKPLPTTTTRGTQNQIVTSHLMKLKGTCKHGQDMRQPAPTIQAGGLHLAEVRAFCMKYYSEGGQFSDCRDPVGTLTTKARMGLVTVQGEDYQITDIGMRMLSPEELFAAQGFPTDYETRPIVDGKFMTKTKQVSMCGNSVCPDVAEAVVRANLVASERSIMQAEGK